MRPTVEVPDSEYYECIDCGDRVTEPTDECCPCGGDLRNLNRGRDL